IRMDTIDGLAVTETICISIGLCLPAVFSDAFPDTLSTYSLIVAAAGCGFLWWNWHPARIRLGEVGSAPLGFALGYLLLLAIASGYGYAVIILPAYYLSDYLLTLLQRIRNEKSIFIDHEEHYHQRAIQ